MAVTEVYVDPSIAADSGSGLIGDPYGDLEYAIEQTTFDTSNGTRVNIKAGTAEVLAAPIDDAMADTTTTPAWSPSSTAPCIFAGYAATAGDRGRGEISGGGSVSIYDNTTIDHTHFQDLKCHNVGNNQIIRMDDICSVIRCEVSGTTISSGNCVALGNYGTVRNCYIHDFIDQGVTGTTATKFLNNWIDCANGPTVDKAISLSTGSSALFNIIIIGDNGCEGIVATNGGAAMFNSIYANGGTGVGIETTQSTIANTICNNLIEGFSGAGGHAMRIDGPSYNTYANSVYNCATGFEFNGPVIGDHNEGNEILTASPFMDAANGDFRPADTGEVIQGGLPQAFLNS